MGLRNAMIAAVALIALIAAMLFGYALASAGDLHRLSTVAEQWLSPKTTIRHDPIVLTHRVRQLARLETASVELEQRFRGQRGNEQTWAWVGERLELRARGEVVAGVDLGKLADGAIEVDGATVWVALPPAELWRVDLDEQASFIEARERGWFGVPDPHLETQVRREAEVALGEEALRGGILERADAQAEAAIRELLGAAGVGDVRFR